jgi:DNA excision repair protein ERCC-3
LLDYEDVFKNQKNKKYFFLNDFEKEILQSDIKIISMYENSFSVLDSKIPSYISQQRNFRLEVKGDQIDIIRKGREGMEKYKYMLSQEYEFKTDQTPDIDIQVKSIIKIRAYQESAINRIFCKGRARSGIIVLPCGAGKTLIGILTLCRMKKRTLILCINNLTVRQWFRQIELFCNVDSSRIFKFISEEKSADKIDLDKYDILISTYKMMSHRDEHRSKYAADIMSQVKKVDWGLLILDEVQVGPAEVFKKSFLNKTKSHCKIGLTATLIREDNKIGEGFIMF